MPKNNRGFKNKKYTPGIAHKRINTEIETNFFKLILFIKKIKRNIKKKI